MPSQNILLLGLPVLALNCYINFIPYCASNIYFFKQETIIYFIIQISFIYVFRSIEGRFIIIDHKLRLQDINWLNGNTNLTYLFSGNIANFKLSSKY